MVDLQCPVCKADSYLNPTIKMFVSPCFHKICESCLYKHFQQGYAPCPECGNLLRRVNFISSTFEDLEVEREIKIRKTMNKHFIRNEDDFNNEVEYNDYLEEYENVVFELLELKNDNEIRDKINEIKQTKSILVPQMRSKPEILQERKKAKIEESNWCIYHPILTNKPCIDPNVSIPKDFITANIPGGFTKQNALDFFVYSLYELI